VGGLLAFQPAAPEAPLPEAFARARAWMEEGKGLSVVGESAGVVKFGRVRGRASGLATSERGWLAAAGTFDHEDLPACDDAAALLALLEERGPAALDALEGSFALAWTSGDTLTVALDLHGRLHAFVAETRDGVFLATSSTALAAAAGCEPDPEGVFEFLAGGTLYEHRTPFRRVRRLEAGGRYVFRGGRLASRHAEPLLPGGTGAAPLEPTVDALLESFARRLDRFLAPCDRPLADLTGGVDSRVVLGLLARGGHACDVTVSGDPDDGDVVVATRLARRLGRTMLAEPRAVMRERQRSFPEVLRAAARAEGFYDAIEYASIAAIHERHAGPYDASVNGSGGEVYRNYWWGRGNLDRTDLDPVPEANRRIAGNALEPLVLADARDPAAHYAEVLARVVRAGDPLHLALDHAYLYLRMQCWQGAIASASNQLWPIYSPLMWRGPLETLFGVDPHHRLGGRLQHALLARFGGIYATEPLETGLPPCRPTLASAWRFVPGLVRLPLRYAPRVRRRLFGAPPAPDADAELARDLCAGGAADWLAPKEMALLPLLDRARYDAFLALARTTGKVPLPLLGRLLALELAMREAARYGRRSRS